MKRSATFAWALVAAGLLLLVLAASVDAKGQGDAPEPRGRTPAEAHVAKQTQEDREFRAKQAERRETFERALERDTVAAEEREVARRALEAELAREAAAHERRLAKEREEFRADHHAHEGRKGRVAKVVALGDAGDRFGAFFRGGERLEGVFVSFDLDREAGLLRNVTVLGEVVLDRVHVGADPTVHVSGSTLTVEGPLAEVRLVDAPALSLRIVTRGEHTTLDVADHFNLTEDGVASSAGTLGRIRGTWTVQDDFTLKVSPHGRATLVLAGPPPGLPGHDAGAGLRDRLDAEVSWRLGAAQAVPLGDLDVEAEVAADHLRVTLSAGAPGPRLLAVHLPAPAAEVRWFEVVADALVERPATQGEPGDAEDAPGGARWTVAEAPAGSILLVAASDVRHHVLWIGPALPLGAVPLVAGVLAGAVVTLGAAVLLLRPRRP